MNEKDTKRLINKYLEDKCNDFEKNIIDYWYNEISENQPVPGHDFVDEHSMTNMWKNLIRERRKMVFIRYLKNAAAAAAFITGIGLLYNHYSPRQDDHKSIATIVKAIPTIGKKGTLVLPDGTKIDLASAPPGQLCKSNGLTITMTPTRQIEFKPVNSAEKNEDTGMYCIVIPYGGESRIVLPDDTKVHLNAATTLKFSPQFNRHKRSVTVNGEAYFDVAAYHAKPFEVKDKKQTIKVLCTAFNVNSSDEENVITSLVSGKVLVKSNSSSKSQILLPGQQSCLSGQQLSLKTTNLDDALAWENGYITFNDEPLADAMKQVEKLYDVKIEIHGDPSRRITAECERRWNLKKVIETLEFTTKLKYSYDGHTVKVY